MSRIQFAIPRWTDRQLLEHLSDINDKIGGGCTFAISPFEGAQSIGGLWAKIRDDERLKQVLSHEEATIQQVTLQSGDRTVMYVVRQHSRPTDEATVEQWSSVNQVLHEAQYIVLRAEAQRALHAIRIDRVRDDVDKDRELTAREVALSRLEGIAADLLRGMRDVGLEMQREHQKRLQALEAERETQRVGDQAELEKKRKTIDDREQELADRLKQFETRESKYVRRQLHERILDKIEARNKEFHLTPGTRRLRWPVFVITGALLAISGWVVVVTFNQTAELLTTMANDPSKVGWWPFVLLGIKQLGSAIVFLGCAWFLIRWNDNWFRQHADAEFMFKQLELDINRASWVVEMGLEWKSEQQTEIPPELLDRLTRNLFVDRAAGAREDTPNDIASILLGSASKVHFKAGNTEVEWGGKGIKSAIKEGQKAD